MRRRNPSVNCHSRASKYISLVPCLAGGAGPLIGLHEVIEDLTFGFHPGRKITAIGGLDRSYTPRGRYLTFGAGQRCIKCRIPVDGRGQRQFTHRPPCCPGVQQFLSVGQPIFSRIAILDHINDAQIMGLRRTDLAAGRHHIQRSIHPGETGQTLRASGARDQTEMHFGQSHPGRRHRDAIVTAQSDLKKSTDETLSA